VSEIEFRRCALCKRSDVVEDDDHGIVLFRYSVRRYAHAVCLAKREGTKAALALLPEHEHREFRSWLRFAGPWEKQMIAVLDRRERTRRAREARP
jgi:hypothetical protein